MNSSKPGDKQYTVSYETKEIKYVTQFLLSPGVEEVFLDLSSGIINQDENELPIHTRLAFPWSAVKRLALLLSQVIDDQSQQKTQRQNVGQKVDSKQHVEMPIASIPQLKNDP